MVVGGGPGHRARGTQSTPPPALASAALLVVAQPHMPTREEATRLFEQRRDAWLREDLDAYLALWAEDMTFQSPVHAEPLRGRAAFADVLRDFECQRRRLVIKRAFAMQREIDVGHVLGGELDVDDRPDHPHDPPVRELREGRDRVDGRVHDELGP